MTGRAGIVGGERGVATLKYFSPLERMDVVKIALIGPVYPYRGGIAHYTAMLYRELTAQGHLVSLYSFQRLYPRWLFPGRTDRDPSAVKQIPCQYTLDSLNPLTWRNTARRVLAQQPDILILQWWVPFLAPLWVWQARAARGAGIKVAFICHNVLPHEQRPWDRWIARWTLGQGDQCIVSSQEERARLLALLPEARCEVIPLPVFDMFAGACPRDEARQRLHLPPDVPVLLFFGLVREYKGLRYLLEALPVVRAALDDVRLLIVGEFWHDRQIYLDQIAHLSLAHNVVVVDRYVPDEEVAVYFSAADVVVLPYTSVTASAVAQVAFGFRVPVVTTRVGGLAETVIDGETGLLVPPADPEALAHAIVRYLRDGLRADMVGHIEKRLPIFGWQRIVAALASLVEAV